MSLISIIMPVYNAEKTVEKSIDSIINQTCGNWELVAVDDGSKDSSAAILEKYAKEHSNIRYFCQTNAGPGAARNLAISEAIGDYIAFLDSDDWWEPDFIERINKEVDTASPDVIFYDLIRERENGDPLGVSKISAFSSCSRRDLIRYQMTGKLEWGMVKVIRRSIIADNGLVFSSDSVGEEAIFSYSVLCHSEVIKFIDKPMYHYVMFDNGQHKKGNNDPWNRVVSNMKKHLVSIGAFDEYEATVNSFAIKALSISCYRISISESYGEAKKLINAKIDEYCENYSLDLIEADTLDRVTRILRIFIRSRFILPIYLASKIRKRGR